MYSVSFLVRTLPFPHVPQAFVNAHCLGRNSATFEPNELRDLAEGVARLDPSASVKFVPGIEGLGKIIYTNVRTPRVLLDFSSASAAPSATPASQGGSDGGAAPAAATAVVPHRPLNQEPLLAARIMIEDCLNLLLDIDDIDRMFKAAAARAASDGGASGGGRATKAVPEGADDLLQRRALLLAGITSSFRLPVTPMLPTPLASDAEAAAAAAVADGVFQRVMALAKGRAVIARSLRVLSPPPLDPPLAQPSVPNLDPVQMLWAVLRNATLLFGNTSASPGAGTGGSADAERSLAEASSRIASGAVSALERLQDPAAVVGCLEALTAGLQAPAVQKGGAGGVLPLVKVAMGQQQQQLPVWLGEVIVRLLRKGEELGFRSPGTGGSSGVDTVVATARWRAAMLLLVASLKRHLEALQAVHAAATAAGNAEALRVVDALIARPVVAAAAEHASDEARGQLRGLVMAFAL